MPMDLVTRKCACGCKRTFRVMKTSPQKYYSFSECDPAGKKNKPVKFNYFGFIKGGKP